MAIATSSSSSRRRRGWSEPSSVYSDSRAVCVSSDSRLGADTPTPASRTVPSKWRTWAAWASDFAVVAAAGLVVDVVQTENLSLPTQLRACDEYCRREGLDVLERFKEEGESAKTADRTELQRLLTFCRTNKGKVHFVVVFSLTRFARDKYDHFALRSFLKLLGISLRSATEPIEEGNERLVAQISPRRNRVESWLREAEGCSLAA